MKDIELVAVGSEPLPIELFTEARDGAHAVSFEGAGEEGRVWIGAIEGETGWFPEDQGLHAKGWSECRRWHGGPASDEC